MTDFAANRAGGGGARVGTFDMHQNLANNSGVPSLKAVLFDAAGTLIYLPKGVGFHYADVGLRHGITCDKEAFGRAFAMAWQTMPPRTNNGVPRQDDDRGWWRQLVDRTLDTVHAAPVNRDAYFDELYLEFTRPGVWNLFPEVRRVMEILAPQFSLGIISNFDVRLRIILRQLDLLTQFREIILSSEVGIDKPDRAIFTTALQRFDLDPAEVCYVGDDPKMDWEGAARAGLHVFRLDRSVNDLTALVDWLGCGNMR